MHRDRRVRSPDRSADRPVRARGAVLARRAGGRAVLESGLHSRCSWRGFSRREILLCAQGRLSGRGKNERLSVSRASSQGKGKVAAAGVRVVKVERNGPFGCFVGRGNE